MIDNILDLLSSAKEHYEKNGLLSLVSTGSQFLVDKIFRQCLFSPLDRTQLLSDSNKYWIISEGDEEYFFSSNHGECEFTSPTGHFSQPISFVSELNDCSIIGEEPTFITGDKQIILELAKDNSGVLRNRYGNIRIRDIIQFYIDEVERYELVFPLVRYDHQPSYYHWWMEELSTLRKLEHYQNKTGRDPTILIESNPPEWVIESINALGYNRDKLVEYSERPIICDKLVIPSYNHHVPSDFRPDQVDYNWLKNTAISNISMEETDAIGNRVYISREHAEDREVLNRSDVMYILEPLGFESVELESLSVEEQICLFNNAEIVVGPHGAGFTNMLFSNDSVFIEFIPKGREFAFFRNLAQVLECEYDCVVCESKNTNHDIIVPVDKLKEKMSKQGIK